MKKLRLGIVGIGGICQGPHLQAWARLADEVEIVAVCDIIESRMDFPAIPKNVKKYANYVDLINDEEIDIVDICTPNYLHSIIAVEALEKGKHVITEKPDAVSISEMQRMINAEKESGKVLMAVRNCRQYDISKFYKQYVDAGKCGEIYCGRASYVRRRGIPGKGGWFTTKEQSGGGPLVDLGVHMIDLAIYLMGNPKAVSVTGCTYNKFADTEVSDSVHSQFGDKKEDGVFDVEDLAMGFVRFENGACLQLEFSWASNIEAEEASVELRGTKSGIRFSSISEKNAIWTEDHGLLCDIKPKYQFNDFGHYGCFRDFIDKINGTSEGNYNTTQGMNIIKILQGLYESAKLGKEVLL